ncbi:DUF3298 and DUF4163 domain-containing protein [Salinisphaera hydrothermalis]|uniref:DUF3298 and DUF4163 domain-containing protein n=1 Tax=Salinisphaera hydrothermalis TaxID=563188 RepID=UPI00334096D2
MSNRRLWLRILVPVIAAALVAGWWFVHGDPGAGPRTPSTAASAGGHSPLGEETVMQRFSPKGCKDQCPTVKVSTLRFDNAPKLTATLRRQLLGMAQLGGDKPHKTPSDFKAYAAQLFDDSEAMRRQNPEIAPYSADFKARVVARRDGVLVVRLDTYTFLGGAHGMPVTYYRVIDEDQQRILSLGDMLEPGQHKAFEAKLRAAHTRWAKQQPLDMSNWPFTPSDNAAPMADGMAVTYQAYDIGPYAMGQPTLTIPYDQLHGILKPRFIPGSNAD